eukprot:TRINITY_DN59404_c0_g1_i1.p1 TRINITY_DN59404_c0_g1~~TRINITY_DN59404_c0_g1_i1.p1  ORF type:complete len:225 (-),score=39.63 TRINITY_DN59404_c0_g1_i1:201-875(-)
MPHTFESGKRLGGSMSATSLGFTEPMFHGDGRALAMPPVRLARKPASSIALEGALGCLERSDNYVEWCVPKTAIEGHCLEDEKRLASYELKSPSFQLLGEPFTLRFWPRGRKNVVIHEERLRSTWATLAIQAARPPACLHCRLFIGARSHPYAETEPRRIYFDGCRTLHPDQVFDAHGLRPFDWDDIDHLVLGVEVFENNYDPCHSHSKARRSRRRGVRGAAGP